MNGEDSATAGRGAVEEVAPGLLRVRADNPGVMTLDGTNTWVLTGDGAGAVVIDPGPALAVHLDRVHGLLAERGLGVELVLLTHGHDDHSEGAEQFARRADAPLRAWLSEWSTGLPLAGQEEMQAAGLDLEVVHTPGHTSDSVSLAVGEWLFTGDTVLGRGTTVVAHPDGRLSEYLASLALLRGRVAAGATILLPGHGPVVAEPAAWIDYYLGHRHDRLRAVAGVVGGRASIAARDDDALDELVADVVEVVYADVPRQLWPAAALSVRAQLLYLAEVPPAQQP
ncbi:MAG: hypothetical protein RLZ55_1041 [Actinomycetota bacterium]|jgi:glyoxylase-like metal-dependent hydrolase (beta-lactamase superfamily II)